MKSKANKAAETNAGEPVSGQKLRYTPKPKGSWKKLIGRAKNDDLSLEAYRLGAEWRARMNRVGR